MKSKGFIIPLTILNGMIITAEEISGSIEMESMLFQQKAVYSDQMNNTSIGFNAEYYHGWHNRISLTS